MYIIMLEHASSLIANVYGRVLRKKEFDITLDAVSRCWINIACRLPAAQISSFLFSLSVICQVHTCKPTIRNHNLDGEVNIEFENEMERRLQPQIMAVATVVIGII